MEINKSVFIVAVGFTLFNVGIVCIDKFLLEKTTDRVLKKIQQEYSPSPYGPGFDADKISTLSVADTPKAAWNEIWDKDRGF